jgi:putative transposase
MISTLLMSLFSILFDLLAILRISTSDKDLEILILRQQLRFLQRKTKTPPRISDPERMVLATLLVRYSRFKDSARQHLYQIMLIFKPEPVLRWHRELVRRKWTFKRKRKPGRPVISPELEALIIRLAKENPRWGYDKIQGELLKLGYKLCASSVRNILKRHRIPATSERSSGFWRAFLGHYKDQILACDFFTVESIWLAAQLLLTQPGLRNRHGSWSGI